jgi:hypothetical protein
VGTDLVQALQESVAGRGACGECRHRQKLLLILKHVRNWSYDTLEREVRAVLDIG